MGTTTGKRIDQIEKLSQKVKLTKKEIESAKKIKLTILTEDFPPVNYNQKGKLTGFSVEVVREILNRQGKPDTIELKNWSESYQRLKVEENLAFFSTSRIKQREKMFKESSKKQFLNYSIIC